MITVRKSDERGHFDHGWLDTRHSFSFADYYDPRHMGFRVLRVINDDHIAGGGGFPTHPHRDMEIITVMLAGALQHRDSMGNGSVIRAGEVQRMSAGTGILHSEFNASPTEDAHLLQIWLTPDRRGLRPEYEQKSFEAPPGETARMALVASPSGDEGSLCIHQDVRLYRGTLGSGGSLDLPLAAGRSAWIQVMRGPLDVNGTVLHEGDGAQVEAETLLRLRAVQGADRAMAHAASASTSSAGGETNRPSGSVSSLVAPAPHSAAPPADFLVFDLP